MNPDTTIGTALLDRATYTIDEAATILGIGRTTAYRAARSGEIPTIRIGRRIVVGRQALANILNRNGHEPPMLEDHGETINNRKEPTP
jgi:excisionase family DNA binding protein